MLVEDEPCGLMLAPGCTVSAVISVRALAVVGGGSSSCCSQRSRPWAPNASKTELDMQIFMYAFQQATSVLCIWRIRWLHVETGRPNDRDTLLFHCPPPVSLPLLSECVYVLNECVRVRWQPASHCPIIPAALTLCILWGFLLMRQRVREKKKGRKKRWRNKRRGRLKKSLSWAQNCCRSAKSQQSWTIVCVCVCVLTRVPAVNSLLGAAYRQATVQERVRHLDLDACECDDGGWCYCDFIRVRWMRASALWVRIYLLPYIVTE